MPKGKPSPVLAGRDRIAQSLGYRNYGQLRRARERGEAPNIGHKRVFKSPAGTIVQTTKRGRGFGDIDRRLAARPDARVKLHVTYIDGNGRERQTTIYGHGGRRAGDLIDAYGGDWDDGIADDIMAMYGSAGVGQILAVQAVIV